MGIDQIASLALQLPVHDRVLLASKLWESLEDPSLCAPEPSDSEASELALAREAEMASGQVAPISHEELMKNLRQ